MKNYRHKLVEIIGLARFAPSVHNTQPWSVELGDDYIRIGRSEKRVLGFGDQTGRQTWLSLGIFAEHCKLAAAGANFCTATHISGDSINIKIIGGKPNKDDINLSKYILSRHTDRSIFKPKNLTGSDIETLQGANQLHDVQIHVSNSPDAIERVATLTRRGLSIAFSAPPFRNELAQWVVPRGQVKPVGIAAESLQVGVIREYIEPWLIRSGVSKKFEIEREYRRWHSASGVIFICSRGDTKKYWIEAGMSYARAALTATSLGFAQSTSASIVEASTFHEDIEQLLGTNMRLQSIIRVGMSGSDASLPARRLGADELV